MVETLRPGGAVDCHSGDALATALPDGRHADAADHHRIAAIVRAVLGTMSGDLSAHETSLLAEVEELGRTISAAKAEIAALKVDDITGRHIPSATDELDAIVAHTASATNDILESCETLDRVCADLSGPAAAQLQAATTRIYEACSFQDITGQRISKIVGTLKAIDSRVAQILAAFGGATAIADSQPVPAATAAAGPPSEAMLLNGPQLAAVAMGQSDIDRLLASFD